MVFLAAISLALQTQSQPVFTRLVTEPSGIIELQTAVATLKAPNKPNIWLVGAAHIGDATYYKSIQSILDSRGQVLFEAVEPGKKDKGPMNGVSTTSGFYDLLAKSLGLTFQLNEINYKQPNFVHCDLTWDDLDALQAKATANGTSNKGALTLGTIKTMMDPNSPMYKQFAAFMSSATPGTKEALKVFLIRQLANFNKTSVATFSPAMNDVVIKARNQHVLDTINHELESPQPPHSIAIFYGAGHLAGMAKGLSDQYGYKITDTQWLTVATADPKKVDATGQMLMGAIDKALNPKTTATATTDNRGEGDSPKKGN